MEAAASRTKLRSFALDASLWDRLASETDCDHVLAATGKALGGAKGIENITLDLTCNPSLEKPGNIALAGNLACVADTLTALDVDEGIDLVPYLDAPGCIKTKGTWPDPPAPPPPAGCVKCRDRGERAAATSAE